MLTINAAYMMMSSGSSPSSKTAINIEAFGGAKIFFQKLFPLTRLRWLYELRLLKMFVSSLMCIAMKAFSMPAAASKYIRLICMVFFVKRHEN